MKPRPFEIRDDLRDLPPYRAPQADARLRLNTNESPWAPPDAVLEDLRDAIASLALNRYPDRDATKLRALLGARYSWPAAGVWPANGSNEVLQTVLLAFGGPGRSALVFEPTYAMHAHIARVTGTDVVRANVEEPWVLDATSVGEEVSRVQPAVTFICSPNNPTGNAQPLDVIEAALEAGTGIVVADEAYADFGGTSALGVLGRQERLCVARSFSKSWRLAGARLGFLLAHPWLIEALQAVRLPYHLSALSQACAEIALKHAAVLQPAIDEIVLERARLAQEMARVPGIEVFPSDANFILFRTPGEGTALWEALANEDVLVRDFSTMIPRCLRVTIGTGEQNASFVEALRRVLSVART